MNFDRYRRSRWQPTALALALSMSLGGVAMAQSNASGVIFGNAGDAAGATVHVENVNTGQSRDITVDGAGRYRASSLPVGTYTVTLKRGDQVIGSHDNVQVRVGSGTDVSFDTGASEAGAKTLGGVTVVSSVLSLIQSPGR